MTQVFISYAREDWEIAKRIYDDLKQNGARPWMDREDILIGQNWKFAIRQAITKSEYFLALLSSNSVTKRGYVQKELKIALDVLEEMPQSDIFILPILLEECEVIEERLKDLHWGELYSSYDGCLSQVLRVVCPKKNRQDDEGFFFLPKDSVIWSMVAPAPVDPNDAITFFGTEIGQKAFKLNNNWRPVEYIENAYKDNGDGTIFDQATGLTWQQSGSDNLWNYINAKAYVQQLNIKKFAGYIDWRMPSVVELISLLEPLQQSNNLFIDSFFDARQQWCWALEMSSSVSAWNVNFDFGKVNSYSVKNFLYVRAVRS